MEHHENQSGQHAVSYEEVRQQYVRCRLRRQPDMNKRYQKSKSISDLTDMINRCQLDLVDYLDWCYRKYPDMYLGRLKSDHCVAEFISQGKRNPVRDDVFNHIYLMYDRFNTELFFVPNTRKVLATKKLEFLPVFVLALATHYNLLDLRTDQLMQQARATCWLTPQYFEVLGHLLPFKFQDLTEKDVTHGSSPEHD